MNNESDLKKNHSIFVLKCFRERMNSNYLDLSSQPQNTQVCCVYKDNTILNYKIRNAHVQRSFKIKLYTSNQSVLNYPTNIPQTRQQNNQSTTKIYKYKM